jgi:hypothetical protein
MVLLRAQTQLFLVVTIDSGCCSTDAAETVWV